ncbi:MAG: Gfo/Idh/MocA family oxidoreductase [Planctomycetota bacterium]
MGHRLGIIGAGGIGAIHAETARRAGHPIDVVCDADAECANAFAATHEIADIATDLDALLDGMVDAVIIAVPNDLHVPLACKAIDAGVDVLLEKPMAEQLDACAPLVHAAEKSDRIVQLNFVTRQAPAVRAAMPLVTSGVLGNIYHVQATMVRQRGVPGLGRWFTTKARSGGGVLIDLGVHVIDLVMQLTGRPTATSVAADCRCEFAHAINDYQFDEMWSGPPNPGGICDVEDTANAFIRFDTGMTLQLTLAWASNVAPGVMTEGIVLCGDQGACHIDAWGGVAHLMHGRGGHIEDEHLEVDSDDPWNAAWERQHRHFAELCASRSPASAPVQHGLDAQRVIEAIYEAGEM